MNNNKLIEWYLQNKRDLPWRKTKNPYKIWLSEIILQQTQVKQGLPYYQNFLTHYPDVQALAKAKEQEVLNLWQGLGYYSRARNLHYTAKDIVTHYKGTFPKTYKELLKLKGVGEYTAAAIASFCYNEPVAVLDGNVYRVLSRLFGIDTAINTTEGKKIFKQIAQKQLDKQQPGLYNQAIMEFGALHCKPARPKCKNCPLATDCLALQTGQTENLPVKVSKVNIKQRYLHYFLVEWQDHIILEKRENKDIWLNLFQLPLIETGSNNHISSKKLEKLFDKYNITPLKKPVIQETKLHKLTHQHLHITFWRLKSQKKPLQNVSKSTLKNYPLPIVIANFLDNYIL